MNNQVILLMACIVSESNAFSREQLEKLEGMRLCIQALKGKKDLGLLGMQQKGIARKVGEYQTCVSGFMQTGARPGGTVGLGRSLGRQDLRCKKCLRQRELSVHPHLEPQRLPHCRGGFMLCVVRSLRGISRREFIRRVLCRPFSLENSK